MLEAIMKVKGRIVRSSRDKGALLDHFRDQGACEPRA